MITYKVVDLSGSDDRIYLGEISDSANTIISVLREMNFHGLKTLDEGTLQKFLSISPLESSAWALLPVVLGTGLIDGINPCAFLGFIILHGIPVQHPNASKKGTTGRCCVYYSHFSCLSRYRSGPAEGDSSLRRAASDSESSMDNGPIFGIHYPA